MLDLKMFKRKIHKVLGRPKGPGANDIGDHTQEKRKFTLYNTNNPNLKFITHRLDQSDGP